MVLKFPIEVSYVKLFIKCVQMDKETKVLSFCCLNSTVYSDWRQTISAFTEL